MEAVGAVAAPRRSEAATASLASRRHAIIMRGLSRVACCRVSSSRARSGRGSRASGFASGSRNGGGGEGQEIRAALGLADSVSFSFVERD